MDGDIRGNLGPAISVGLLTADLQTLGAEVLRVKGAGARFIHFDVMDGCFTPALTFGAPLVAAVQTNLLKDVHLMVQDPLEKIEAFIASGANILTVHVESCIHIHRVLQRMGSLAAEKSSPCFLRGIAVNPGTPIDTLRPLLDEVDYILLLAVNPGWPGQKFLHSTARRLTDVRELIAETGRDILVGVDGGISRKNIGEVAAMKPDIIVIGSAIFDGGDAANNLRFMMAAVASVRMEADAKSLVG